MEHKYTQVIEENKKIIYKVCNLYCKSEIDKEDLFQEIVLRLWKGFSSFEGKSKISTWIYRVSINTAITVNRLNERRPKLSSLEKHGFTIMNEIQESDHNEEITLLLKCINKLNDLEKAIIHLYLDEVSYQEIGAIVGISTSNVATKISRIKIKLKDIIENNANY
ncbi:MAG: sigma-70 family RNA polymerase sigma factor [Bacteroidales bacterium]|nr:sigma-70 family RNA polymerase sigma factor [Bacteroidales bacterium]